MSKSVLNQRKILAVDDEPDVLAVLKDEIGASCTDCRVDSATTYDEAVKLLSSNEYDLIILDIMGVRGFDLLEMAVSKKMRAVMLTAHALSPENLKRAHDMGARAYLPKQKLGEIVPFLEDALKYEFEPGWKRNLEVLKDVLSDLWGRDWEKIEKDVGTKMSPRES
ncbi:MAG TPA: response regulator [Syntrophorhabdaceae bacterium]|nr:response regulator [Syntrophorhabdaceae bacterium]